MPTFEIELLYKGLVGGVDEAGRGPWAGPVVVAVAIFLESPPLFLFDNIEDSKKITKAKREVIYGELLKLGSFHYGVGVASVEEIDRLNISKATFLAMKRAVEKLPQTPHTLLIDGKYIPSFEGIQTRPVIGGDGISLSIAAASILAKVTRDQMMEKLALEHPQYGWERNVGYGTAEHQNALKSFGVTPHHRKSFAPVSALLNPI
ncbi:MAG: ribonuclease HII [Alphaproteobacteria bacterium 41-28]|nr:MAG: ribonuclease HII [Alphaproteobacteria bacterium 41-28]